MRGLKVGIFTETYRPQINGVVTSIENLKKILIERGAQPIVFTVGRESGVKKEDFTIVHRFKSVAYPFYPEYRFAPSRFRKVKKVVEKYKLDLLHSHGPFSMGLNALYAHKNLKIPLIGTFHTLLPEYIHYFIGEKSAEHFGLFLKRYSWRYLKWYYSRCDVITCPSKTTANLLKQKSFENVLIISNGIDTKKFNPNVSGSKFKKAYGISENEKIILYLGRISAEKNIPFIVKSASLVVKKIKDVKFIIAGEGPAKGELISLINEMKLNENFIFTGVLPSDLLLSTYAAANVFVISSHTDTQGLAILEAMSSGKPIVAAYSGVLGELVKDGRNGFTAKDVEDFAEKTIQILRDVNLERKMGEESRKMVYDHSFERVGDQIAQLYNSLLSK